jgi:hypothetical protein
VFVPLKNNVFAKDPGLKAKKITLFVNILSSYEILIILTGVYIRV